MGNPTQGETVGVEIVSGGGQRLLLTMTNSRGRVVNEQTVVDAKAIERQTIQVSPSAGVCPLQYRP